MCKAVLTGGPLAWPLLSRKETEEALADRPKGRIHSDPTFAAMTEDLDAGVGMVLRKIEELGIADNTYVFYMSDNGAGPRFSPCTPLTLGKGTLWEGGIRVPLIVRGPGVNAGAFCGQRVVGWNLFPTFCELAGVKEPLPEDLEGGSPKPLFTSREDDVKRPREEVVFHYPHYGLGGKGKTPQSAIFIGDHKLIKFYETNELRLFNIGKDIGEQNDLSKELPEKTEIMMHRRLEKYLQQVDTAMPSPTPTTIPTLPCRQDGRPAANAEDREWGQDEDALVCHVPRELLRKLLSGALEGDVEKQTKTTQGEQRER